jgi:hypothetical protein
MIAFPVHLFSHSYYFFRAGWDANFAPFAPFDINYDFSSVFCHNNLSVSLNFEVAKLDIYCNSEAVIIKK